MWLINPALSTSEIHDILVGAASRPANQALVPLSVSGGMMHPEKAYAEAARLSPAKCSVSSGRGRSLPKPGSSQPRSSEPRRPRGRSLPK